MRDLCSDPAWRKEDLGLPIPDSPHAVSVAMPLWEHVVGYEEGDPAILDALSCGYPRFVYHPFVSKLFARCTERYAEEGETCLALPSRRVAERCVAYIKSKTGHLSSIVETGENGIHAVVLPEEDLPVAKRFWQHTGDIISSRLANDTLQSMAAPQGSALAKRVLRHRIADLVDEPVDNIYLYPSGMSAIAAIQRVFALLHPDAWSIQLGFPYVDTLKIQNELGPGAYFIACVGEDEVRQLHERMAEAPISGVFAEFPGNPTLKSVDLKALARTLKNRGLPLVIDDTIGTFINVDVKPYADVLMSSLTKYFSGVGDVIGGSLVLNSQSPMFRELKGALDKDYEDLFWGADAVALEANSRDFVARMHNTNRTAEALCAWLLEQPEVDKVFYPKYETPRAYAQAMRPDGGYGGMLSILLHDPARSAPAFYDALRVSKGPNLGTNYTLACPYTLLAHYQELDWAASCGVSPWLVRVSVGQEAVEDLLERFRDALGAIG